MYCTVLYCTVLYCRYEYTRSHDRLWRKNTVPIPGSSCIGVDINRNFPEGYGIGASTNPCSEVYQGETSSHCY